MIQIDIQTKLNRYGPLPPLERAEEAARKLLAEEEIESAEVSVLLTDDSGIQELNRHWRGIDTPTDVLSWPQVEADQAKNVVYLGDVAISLDTAQRQAEARQWAVEEETALLLLHGMLHLLGYEDDTEEGAAAMQVVETRILGKPLEKIPVAGNTSGNIEL